VAVEPRDEMYSELVTQVGSLASTLGMVCRHELPLSAEGVAVVQALEPWLKREEEVQRWPGTSLLGNATATLRTYRVRNRVLEILGSSVSGLYEWTDGYPEDPSFLRADQSVILSVSAHEREAQLFLTETEAVALLLRCPGLDRCVAL
jgi:hypothetical protein